jgi:hypothetical protein
VEGARTPYTHAKAHVRGFRDAIRHRDMRCVISGVEFIADPVTEKVKNTFGVIFKCLAKNRDDFKPGDETR